MIYTTEQLEAMLAATSQGPWTIRKWAQAMTITGNVHQVVSEENYPTAFVPAWDDPGPGEIDGTDEAKANAAIIAAAPTITAELIAARKRIAELDGALRPLAAMAERYDPDDGDGDLECWSGLAVPRIKHLRAARAALAAWDAAQ